MLRKFAGTSVGCQIYHGKLFANDEPKLVLIADSNKVIFINIRHLSKTIYFQIFSSKINKFI